jgi:hypothetical protein
LLGVNQTTLLGAEAFFANKYIAEKGSGKVGFQFGKKF